MKEQKTTKWSNFNPLCLARHVLRNLWMTVLAGLICVMAVYLLQTLVSKPSYDSQVTFAVTSRSASATASGSIAVTDSVASQFGELLQSNPVRTAAAAEMGLNAFPGTCSVDVPENTNILILTVTAPTPELAFRGALAVMDCYEAYADFILASAVLNPINGPTLPSQPSAQASRDRLLRLAGPIGALAMIAVLLLLAVSQETVQTVPGARDQLDTKLLATLRHERKRGALLRNKKSALLISDPTCSFYYTETVHQLRAQVERAHEKDGRQVFLITSCAETFSALFPDGPKYRIWAIIFSLVSLLFANLGLSAIISYSLPVLMFLYPLSIALIALALLGKFFGHDRTVYCWTIGFTLIAAVYDLIIALPESVFNAIHGPAIKAFGQQYLPFADLGLGWICPTLIGAAIGLILHFMRGNRAKA